MGKYIQNVGPYSVIMGDWVFDYVKDRKKKEYYDNYLIDVEITNNATQEKSDIKVPLSLFGKPVLLKKKYRFEFNDEWDMLGILEYYFKIKNIKFVFEAKVYTCIHIGGAVSNFERVFYYLNSMIGDDNNDVLLIKDKPRVHLIGGRKDIDWCRKNGLKIQYIY